MIDKILHQFLLDGGQVTSSTRSGSEVTLPDHWWDIHAREKLEVLKAHVLSEVLACPHFPGRTVAEAADRLRMRYRHVLELIRFQHLGTIKLGGKIQVYDPSISEYIRKLTEKKSWSHLWN